MKRDDLFKTLREIYIGSPNLTLKELSDMSQDLCGKFVDLDAIATRSRIEGWDVERNALRNDNTSVASEVHHIRQIVYQQIVAANESGLLLVGDFDHEEVTSLLKGIEGLRVTKLRPGGVDAAMVNAYMNLLAKSNIRLDMVGASGKTSREQGLDLFKEAMAELAEYESDLE